MKKAVIVAPFWRQSGHVGNNRVDRFVRWLSEDGYQVVMIRAGSQDERRETSWGEELTVRDPLGLYREAAPGSAAPAPRKPNKLRRWLAYWLFNPDPEIVWARAAAANSSVQAVAVDAAFILSSSPPESAHVGAWMLSKRLNRPHIVDMRDGWLDEPLKPILVNSALRRWLEARLEVKILANARTIFVTSDVWRDLLCQRLPAVADKTVVLTNGYPKEAKGGETKTDPVPTEDGLVLIHAGRFSGSDTRRTPGVLLEPLLSAIRQSHAHGVVKLIGPLAADELAVIEKFQDRFEEAGWRIECPGSMLRDKLLKELPKASGLLLLSASSAAIPSKLFEYIPTGRPMLVVTERNSATWRICQGLPQAYLVDVEINKTSDVVTGFIHKTKLIKSDLNVPNEFREIFLNRIFKKNVRKMLAGENK